MKSSFANRTELGLSETRIHIRRSSLVRLAMHSPCSSHRRLLGVWKYSREELSRGLNRTQRQVVRSQSRQRQLCSRANAFQRTTRIANDSRLRPTLRHSRISGRRILAAPESVFRRSSKRNRKYRTEERRPAYVDCLTCVCDIRWSIRSTVHDAPRTYQLPWICNASAPSCSRLCSNAPERLMDTSTMEENVAKQHRSLLTPGPMSLSSAVKAQMQFDLASRDFEFKELTARMRRLALNLSGNAKSYSVVPIQGGGSFGMEAALSSFISQADKPLVCINGIYGERILKILRLWGVPAVKLVKRSTEPLDPQEISECLSQDQAITHLCFVHCETTTGIFNPLEAIVESARRRGVKTIVDGMSSFGGIKIDLSRGGPDVLVTSSNKCIEGPPGVAFVIASRELLENADQAPRSFVLDVRDQWLSLERTGEWRSTPPTHIVQAATKALELLGDEGIDCRRRRYEKIRDDIIKELEGVVPPLLSAHLQSPICVAFTAPPGISDQAAFDGLYSYLAAHNLYIYSKLHLPTRSFRIGCIGEIQTSWIEQLGCALRTFFRSGGNKLPGRVSAQETCRNSAERDWLRPRSTHFPLKPPFCTRDTVATPQRKLWQCRFTRIRLMNSTAI